MRQGRGGGGRRDWGVGEHWRGCEWGEGWSLHGADLGGRVKEQGKRGKKAERRGEGKCKKGEGGGVR